MAKKASSEKAAYVSKNFRRRTAFLRAAGQDGPTPAKRDF